MATMYTVQETADYLGVSKKTVYKWIAEGSLKAQKIGKRMIRIDELDLYSFIRPVTH
jgi:excisionase family DNA binding protein